MKRVCCIIAVGVSFGCTTNPHTSASLPPAVASAPHPIPAWTIDAQLDVETGVSVARLVAVARAMIRDGELGRARNRLVEALRIDPIHPEVLWELGWVEFVSDSAGRALNNWSLLRAIDPEYPGLRRYLSIAQSRLNRRIARERGTGPLVELEPRGPDVLTVSAVGDIQLGMGWPSNRKTLPPDSAKSLFQHVRQVIGRADIGFGNLETALADSGESTKCRTGSTNCYAFRAPVIYAATLRASGFDVMSINNNHAGDFGSVGRRDTELALDSAGVAWSGPGGIASWERNGQRVALLAFSTGEGPYRVPDIPGAVQAVRDAERDHDLVIVSFHGGAEGSAHTRVPKRVERAYGENRGDVYAFSRAMVDAGADLVLGHGPHVLRGMEVYRGRFIAYSLGNFTSWNGFNLSGPLGVSAVLTVSLAPNGVALGAELFPVRLFRPGIPTPDAASTAIRLIRKYSLDDFGDSLFDEQGVWRRQATPAGPSP